jgi:Holliday junction resolvase
MTPEAKVKNKVKKLLDEFGAYHFMPATHGYGRSGVPDIVACANGWFFGIECKAGKNTVTDLQAREMLKIVSARGYALVVDDSSSSLDALKYALEIVYRGK